MTENLSQLIEEVTKHRCETQTIEVKSAAGGVPSVHDTLSSFSNQNEGGVILFGIDERNNFEITGVPNAQELQKKLHGQCQAMTPEVRPVFVVSDFHGKTVVAAYISGRPMSERPTYQTVRGKAQGSYVRIGDADVHMSATELYEIESFKDGRRDDISVDSRASLEMLDEAQVAAFVAAAQEERPLLARRSRNEILNLAGATHNGIPTLSGMMTLGDYPQRVYPNLCVTAVAVAGTAISYGEEGERFLDSKRYEGTIAQIIEDAMGFVSRNTKRRTVIRDGKRMDIAEYPETAVREILTNALMHRDYGPYGNGTPVRLTLFSDRLECWNPGGVYGGQSVDELGFVNSQTRNPTLVSILELQKIAENRHSGIPVIRDEARARGVREPEFLDRQGTFMVRFYNEQREVGNSADGNPESTGYLELCDDIVRFCQRARSAREIADRFGYNVTYMRRVYIRPLLEEKRLFLTMPDKPRSKQQRYVSGSRVDF